MVKIETWVELYKQEQKAIEYHFAVYDLKEISWG